MFVSKLHLFAMYNIDVVSLFVLRNVGVYISYIKIALHSEHIRAHGYTGNTAPIYIHWLVYHCRKLDEE